MYVNLTKCPNFTWYLAEKLTKFTNFVSDLSEKFQKCTWEFPEKYFPRFFWWGGGHVPLPPRLLRLGQSTFISSKQFPLQKIACQLWVNDFKLHHVKFRHFVNLSYMYFRAKCLAPMLTELSLKDLEVRTTLLAELWPLKKFIRYFLPLPSGVCSV